MEVQEKKKCRRPEYYVIKQNIKLKNKAKHSKSNRKQNEKNKK